MYLISLIGKSLFFSLVAILFAYFSNYLLNIQAYLSDVSGIGSFVSIFGTLYGIFTAFIVLEVWGQFNKITGLIDEEAHGLERLYRLTLYFKDKRLNQEMLKAIKDYANLVIKSKFKSLGKGERNPATAEAFRKIAGIIKSVRFDDEHDSIVFNSIIEHYGRLHEIRSARITQSIARLPMPLKSFLYITSFMAVAFFILMPFSNIYYSFLIVGSLAFVLSMILQLIKDLDNPFVGHWNVTIEPFERSLRHIEEDY